MGASPEYRVVFDIGQRIPSTFVLVAALGLLAAIVIGLAVPRWRSATRGRLPAVALISAVLLVVAALLAGMVIGAVFLGIWVVVGLTLVLVFENPDVRETVGWRRGPPGAATGVFVAISLTMASIFGLVGLPAIALTARLREGAGEVLQGPITAYRADSKRDCFDVADREFCVSEANVTPGFSQQQMTGSPLATGAIVRLTVFGTLIARVEIAMPVAP